MPSQRSWPRSRCRPRPTAPSRDRACPRPTVPRPRDRASQPAGRSPMSRRARQAVRARRSPRVWRGGSEHAAPAAAGGRLCWRDAGAISSQAARHGSSYPRCAAQGPALWRRVPAMRSRQFSDGKMLAKCVPGAWSWRYVDAAHSRAPCRGRISTRCVPGRPSVASFSLHASPKGPRTGKAPLPGNISPPCIQNELALARYARHVSEKRCKSPFGNAWRADLAREGPFSPHWPLKSCTARRSCRDSALVRSYGRKAGGDGSLQARFGLRPTAPMFAHARGRRPRIP